MIRTPLFSNAPAGYEIARVEFTETGPETVWVPSGQAPIDEAEIPY